MGDRSSIEWTDATWNPVSGCSKVSRGCKFCYAEKLFPRPYPGRPFTSVRTHPDRLDQPLRWQRPRRIFVNSMSDLFHGQVPDSFIDEVFHVMARAQRHTFQILTKRPERMCEYVSSAVGRKLELGGGIMMSMRKPLPNVWLGVSVEDQATADERIPLLLQTPAAVRFLSCEPLLGPIDLGRAYPCGYYCDEGVGHVDHPFISGTNSEIHWVIAGGESGARARGCHPDWVRSLRDQCVAAHVPFFFKQWGHGKPCFTSEAITIGDRHYPSGTFSGWDLVGKKHAGRELDGRTWEEFPS